jgi:hypothetical protein
MPWAFVRTVTDCPFTVAEVVLIIAAELLVVVLPELVELALPQATAISAIRSILIPKNARLKVSITYILLANQIKDKLSTSIHTQEGYTISPETGLLRATTLNQNRFDLPQHRKLPWNEIVKGGNLDLGFGALPQLSSFATAGGKSKRIPHSRFAQ